MSTDKADKAAREDLTQAEAFARIRLLRSPNIGPVTYHQLLKRFGNASAALDGLPELGKRGGRSYKPADRGRIEREIEGVRAAGAKYLFHGSDDYPELLAETPGAPPIVTVRGHSALAKRPAIAMVGARNASAAAVKLARTLAGDLASAGWTVVSGLARGIDGAAHEGALNASGEGGTIGVIASGIDIAYPPQHADLQERIAEEGLLIAEQPPATEPRGSHFPSRNRIIAGLALGTVVVEAAPRSGSLITARLAGEAGREVMAVPGSPLDGRSAGCNKLIREGAVLVQSAEDIIELVQGFDGTPRSTFREESAVFDFTSDIADEPLSDAEPADITALLTSAPVAIDELIRQSGESPSSVQLALLELEIAGRLERHAGGKVSLA
jgi:DNA processing protein